MADDDCRFYSLVPEDFPLCDLLIVMGTSLSVYPFASLICESSIHIMNHRGAVRTHMHCHSALQRPLSIPAWAMHADRVRPGVPRLLINRELAGGIDPLLRPQDSVYLGDCDEGVMELAGLLGWRQELEALIKGGQIV